MFFFFLFTKLLSVAEGFAANGATVYISSRKAKACQEAAQEISRATVRERGFFVSFFFLSRKNANREAK